MRARKIGIAIFCLVCFIIMLFVVRGEKGKEAEPLSVTGFAFDTTYTITLYEGGSDDILGECIRRCAGYEKIFSRTNGDSELARINAVSAAYSRAVNENDAIREKWSGLTAGRGVSYTDTERQALESRIAQILKSQESGKAGDGSVDTDSTYSYKINAENGSLSMEVSEDMYNLLQKGLYYCELSGGGFDITIEPVSSLWDFKSDNKKIPDNEQIQKVLDDIDYKRVQLTEQRVEFLRPDIRIDLGGIAKGYIADCLKKILQDNGVKSGVVNLGGNVLCIGEKPDGGKFNIGIQEPFADRNETAMSVGVKDLSVVSSGVYERYFETDDGKIYHHILNPITGYPYDNDIYGVTIISKYSVDGDGLSTTCFALGVERGLELIDSMEDTYAVFITDDGELHYSEGFESMIYN